MTKLPRFKSLKEEREFWDTHDVFEVLGEEGWQIVEPGTTKVKSVYVTKVGEKGAVIYLPREWLVRMGVKKGRKIKAWTEGKRLVVEFV